MGTHRLQRSNRISRGLESLALLDPLCRGLADWLPRLFRVLCPFPAPPGSRPANGHRRQPLSAVIATTCASPASASGSVSGSTMPALPFSSSLLAALIAMPFLESLARHLAGFHPLRLVAPPLTLFTLSVFSKMAFGALTGFEYVAVFAGECRNPRRHLPRSVLAHRAHYRTDLYSRHQRHPGLRFALGRGRRCAHPKLLAAGCKPSASPVSCCRRRCCSCSSTIWPPFAPSSPSAHVCPWSPDGTILLPEWFSRLHPRYKTPINSVLFLGAATLW